MQRETYTDELPPPAADELIVIERILNRCSHGNTERSVHRRMVTSRCTLCGETIDLWMDGQDDSVSPSEEARRWRDSLLRPATHLVVAEQALAHVTRSGWNVQFMQTLDSCVCTLSRGERVVRSISHPTRAVAIVDALAQMASEYSFRG